MAMSTLDALHVIRGGVFYFAVVFAAGFLLGTLRVLFVVPLVGARYAELIELPVMLLIAFFAARIIVKRMSIPPLFTSGALMGVTALILLLAAEFGLVLWLRGMSIGEYFASRDPVSGAVYYVSLLIFAAMPLIVRRG
jgi:hypothetical protein